MSKTRLPRFSPSPLPTQRSIPFEKTRSGVTRQAFVLPELYCPFPSVVNRNAQSADMRTNLWVRQQDLFTDEEAYQRFAHVRLGWLAARTTPRATQKMLQTVTDWCSWFFIRDDYCDEQGIGRNPQAMIQLHQRFLDILSGGSPHITDSVLTHALHELWRRTERAASDSWKQQFTADLTNFFDAGVWEAENRAAGIVPAVSKYLKMRPYTGGLYAYIDLLELSEQLQLPAEVRDDSTVRRLTQMTNNIVCWANDIMSLAKEMKCGDVHNLVFSLRQNHQLSLQEAIDRAAVLHDTEVRNFIKLELELPSFDAMTGDQLKRYTAALRAFMRGSLDWLTTSGRYLTCVGDAVRA